MRTLWEALDVPRPTHAHIHSLSSGHGQTHTYPCVLARRLMDAQPLISRRAAARTQASPDPLALRLVTTQPLTARLTRTHTYARAPYSCSDPLMRRRTHTEVRLRSDARSSRFTPPSSLTPRPTHTEADSYPDAFASRLPRTEPLRLPPPRAEAHSHRVTWTPLGGTSAEGTRQPPSKYPHHSGRLLRLHWDPDRLSCRSGRGVGNPELLKAPGGVFACPRHMSIGKKNATLKIKQV